MSTKKLRLTTTSYSVLSHLALQPWSAYELAVQRVRYFRYFWPRAERGIYDELKRLAAGGLATAQVGHTGRRRRTVYSITPTGRAALRAWLDEPLNPLAIEFEGLLRIFSAPLGSAQQLRTNLERIREDLTALRQFNDSIAQEYLEGRAPFQGQAYVRTMVVEFMTDFAAMAEAWIDRNLEEVAGWNDTRPDRKKMRGASERLKQARRRRETATRQPAAPLDA
jgi:DNA-binding PadR family transcriptional regulator